MSLIDKARTVIDLEIRELEALRDRLGATFVAVVEAIQDTLAKGGKIIVCGVGKSGSVGRKLAATLNSTGAPAVCLDVGDALHGDLGVVSPGDLVIALSHSGRTDELLRLLPHLRRRNIRLAAVTGDPASPLASHSDWVLDARVSREACPLNLAPTSSTTVMLVLCDALAMVLLEARGFRQEDFAGLHPGGSLGRALLTRVRDVMRSGSGLALVRPDSSVRDALQAMTRARCGAAVVQNPDGGLAGVFTHGDFVRAFQSDPGIGGRTVGELMTPSPVTIGADRLAGEVLALLTSHRIDDVVVIDAAGRPVGLVDSQDLTRMNLV
jgi:arabinose-5-phosphate isomerase